MKLSIDNQPTIPFSIIPVNPYLEHWDPKLAKAFIELSKLKYWRDREFVSKEIEYRNGKRDAVSKRAEMLIRKI
jgi:hypothetical protein